MAKPWELTYEEITFATIEGSANVSGYGTGAAEHHYAEHKAVAQAAQHKMGNYIISKLEQVGGILSCISLDWTDPRRECREMQSILVELLQTLRE